MIDVLQATTVILILGVTMVLAWFIAPYVTRIFARAPSRLDRILNPFENAIYRLTGVDPNHAMGWKEYFLAGLLLNICQMVIAFTILTFQGVLPLNPQNFHGLNWDLSFNTVVSFATNTNLQHYNGETTLSYFSQMTAIQFLQFTSAATGIMHGCGDGAGLCGWSQAHG